MKNLLRQPWDRKKWRNGVVRPAIPSVSAALLAFSAVWFAAAAKTLLEGSADFRNWNTDATSVVTVFGVGILCFFPGIIGFLRWAKWRRVSLRLASMPIVIGGTMKGELFMPGSIPDKTPITVKIYNERRTTGGAGRSRRTRTSVIHQDISTVETSVFSMERGLYKMPVEFVIPYDTFDATSNRGDTAYRWRMLVAGSTSGLDINIAMEIPVF
ncbi:MAG TPA: hypothetical protein VLH60_07830, partial [Sedimentisphaerales bacterium]|nr:hypothetical protein [Sedimentisphaerales bacterium]